MDLFINPYADEMAEWLSLTEDIIVVSLRLYKGNLYSSEG